MSYKLFLDDLRVPTDVYPQTDNSSWVIVRNLTDFKKAINEKGIPSYISFDNDLGESMEEGKDAAKWLVFEKEADIRDMDFKVHSANVGGVRDYIKSLLDNWKKHLNSEINESSLPFKEENLRPDIFKRTFSRGLDGYDLKWHTDDEDRKVKVIQSTDWKIQLDNELPQTFYEGKEYFIPKGVFHRVIKGEGDLVVEVQKLKTTAEIKPNNIFSESVNSEIISENLSYHIKNKITLNESVFRIGSDAWLNLVNEVRELYKSGKIELNEDEKFIVESDAGKKANYKGKEVPLEVPSKLYENANLYEVYVNENGKIKRIIFEED